MEPFLGQLSLFGFGFPPRGWAKCDGQILPIAQNTALFSLLGTTYGGDGRTTFALPDLRGRVPVHQGQGPGLSNYDLGEVLGAESVTLTTQQLPPHGHGIQGAATAASKSPSGAVPGYNDAGSSYGPPDGTQMANTMCQPTGAGQPHENRQPTLAMNWCIATEGIFPSRN
jgi:microcystin-dependent protein